MQTILSTINQLLNFWVHTHWLIALAMSTLVNMGVFIICALCITWLTHYLNKAVGFGEYIDKRPLKDGQKKFEFKNGMLACFIFAALSLLTRIWHVDVWPSSIIDFVLQVVMFSVFYEVYSYFVHRVLHFKPFRKAHGVHHRSMTVTPWTAYSVHPIEAFLIACSAPLFMFMFSLSLGVALTLHIIGMVFSIMIHSNFDFYFKVKIVNHLNVFTKFHQYHHELGNKNYGFTNQLLDRLFKTKYK
ncbi:sterol desaturase family protein [Marinicellulosiphila megalodicopiae]|uniref:sterol desaturase family protein n=1 Tax=Marinicellulosiphila megalodicopiae TaxID=2724896 RepID=UPI003BB1B046